MEIYTLLKDDHVKVLGILDELLSLDDNDSYRDVLIDQVRDELIPHARAEEAVFYNSMRAVSSDNSEVMHGYKEHIEAESVLRLLQVKDATNMDWKETATKLKESLEHHIEEEESKIFAEAKTMFSDEEVEMMGKAFLKLKEEVKGQGMLKNSFDLVANLMPPRFINQLKGISSVDR